MKKAILADANFSCLPVLKSLKSFGYHAAVVGSRQADPCHLLADVSLNIDYSNIQKFESEVRAFGAKFLIAGCNDVSYVACSKIANKTGLPGYDADNITEIIHNKNLFRKLCLEKNYPSPKCAEDLESASSLKFPILFKPSVSFSGKGIVKFESHSELKSWSVTTSEFDGVFEEFNQGDLYSHSAFIRNGKIFCDFFVREFCTVYPFQVNSSCIALDIGLALKLKVQSWVNTFILDLDLVDGLIHTQFLSDGISFVLLEVCRRCPGDLYSLLIEKSTGMDYAALYAQGFTKEQSLEVKNTKKKYITRHTVSIESDAIFLGCKLKEQFKDSVFYPLKTAGEIIRPAPFDKAGIYFIEHNSAEDMLRTTSDMRHIVDVELISLEIV